jgi:hypothetical protein
MSGTPRQFYHYSPPERSIPTRKVFPPSTRLSAVLLRQHYPLAHGAILADDAA